MALYTYMLTLLLSLQHAWVDRAETPDARLERMQDLAGEIVNAVEEAFPENLELQREYAVTMVFLAHRETMLARRNANMSNADVGGAAHGYWQVHVWRGLDPFAAATALDYLRSDAWGGWRLPTSAPWLGLPKAAAYLRVHPLAGQTTKIGGMISHGSS